METNPIWDHAASSGGGAWTDAIASAIAPASDVSLARHRRHNSGVSVAATARTANGASRKILAFLVEDQGQWSVWRLVTVAADSRPNIVWDSSGSWRNPDRTHFVGAWIDDDRIRYVRVHDGHGRSVIEPMHAGVVLLEFGDDFDMRAAVVDLIDAQDDVVKVGALLPPRIPPRAAENGGRYAH